MASPLYEFFFRSLCSIVFFFFFPYFFVCIICLVQNFLLSCLIVD
uniref:Uncharacterized protein n=1 Tax=Rhizophora mucronata TaxID=61149 RepID=A0A2P2NA19_RHIMU